MNYVLEIIRDALVATPDLVSFSKVELHDDGLHIWLRGTGERLVVTAKRLTP